jgi:hypothetical protein
MPKAWNVPEADVLPLFASDSMQFGCSDNGVACTLFSFLLDTPAVSEVDWSNTGLKGNDYEFYWVL